MKKLSFPLEESLNQDSFTPSGSSGDKRYVGIWYTWDKRTVVWVANRDDPLINGTGAFRFATDGNLQVWDTSSRKFYWYKRDRKKCCLCEN